MIDPVEEYAALADEIAERLRAAGWSVATAESLTGGAIATTLAAAPDAGEWFLGSVVAYAERVKRELLGVTADDVVSDDAARQLAAGVAHLCGADAAVAVTGVGGPEPSDGAPAGTVFAAASTPAGLRSARFAFEGDPHEVVHATIGAALGLLREVLPPV